MHSDLMVSVLDSVASVPFSIPGCGNCVVFLGETLKSHSASLHPGVYEWVLANSLLGVTLLWCSIPSRGSRNTPSRFILQKLG